LAYSTLVTHGKTYSVNGAKTHLKHVLRDRYDPERIPEPNIAVYKYEHGKFEPAKKEEVYALYDFNLSKKQRKNAVIYEDYWVSGYDPEKTEQIAAFFSEQLEGRPVFAVEHRDEGHYHTHFILFWKDPTHLKSPNLSKGVLHQWRVEIGRITGQKVKEKGTGTQKKVGLVADPKEQENRLLEEKRRQAHAEEILKQIKPMIDIYGAITIYSLNTEKGVRFQLHNGSGRTVFDNVEQIPVLKLMQLDDKPGENVVFIPETFSKDGKEYVKGLFLDDVPEEALDHLPNGTVIVQTSKNKYQAHIPLPEPMWKETADQLQRLLVDYYEADPGAKWLLHPRRLPGLKNKKYQERPIAKVVKVVKSDVTINRLLAEVEINTKQHRQMQDKRWTLIEKKSPKVARQIEEILEVEGESTWQRFFEESGGDRSSADMKYVLRLLRKGYDPQAVAYALMEISPDLIIRKPKHVEDYVERTITKALSILQPVSQEKEQNHNPEK